MDDYLCLAYVQIRLEQERKERLKQKERDKKQRHRLEGKPVTKKEKEAEAKRLATVAMLKEQGNIFIICQDMFLQFIIEFLVFLQA